MFKQFLEAGAMDFCQIDSCRLGGVNKIIAVILLAAKFNIIPVCPHAGGVGLRIRASLGGLYLCICYAGESNGGVCRPPTRTHGVFRHCQGWKVLPSRGSRLCPDKGSINAAVRIPRWTNLEELRLPVARQV